MPTTDKNCWYGQPQVESLELLLFSLRKYVLGVTNCLQQTPEEKQVKWISFTQLLSFKQHRDNCKTDGASYDISLFNTMETVAFILNLWSAEFI